LLKDKLVYLRNMLHVMGRPATPPDLIFFITSRCNARCEFCHFISQINDPERKNKELTLDEIRVVAQNYGRVSKLSLCGGEPFLRSDVAEIVQAFVDLCATRIVDIPTNGFYTAAILKQTATILAANPSLALEIQLSIDGPPAVHDRVRKVPGLYERCMQTIGELERLREKHSNLRIKMNVVYQPANRQSTYQLAQDFEKRFAFDRFQITFPHGDAELQTKIADLSYEEFYRMSRRILLHMRQRRRFDLHSLLFRAIKILRDEVLKDILKDTDMGKVCHAGERILVVDDIGEVYPCEPLWESVGNLRQAHYNIKEILNAPAMHIFRQKHLGCGKCHCTWGCVVLDQIIFNPRYYYKILYYMLYLAWGGGKGLNEWTADNESG